MIFFCFSVSFHQHNLVKYRNSLHMQEAINMSCKAILMILISVKKKKNSFLLFFSRDKSEKGYRTTSASTRVCLCCDDLLTQKIIRRITRPAIKLNDEHAMNHLNRSMVDCKCHWMGARSDSFIRRDEAGFSRASVSHV